MLIAVIAVVHVLVSHYAVGGGFFLAVETTHAYRTANREYLGYLKRHAKFFVLLTVVFGAITGVGIWWTIGLASPLATRLLIRTFVFAWGTEWVCFVVEIVSAFIFYYYWDRLPRRLHLAVVWIYALAAWASLVIITAITAFMLDPGRWPANHDFWSGLANQQTLPQIIARTGGALLLSSLYVYFHAALAIKEPKLHALIESRSARPALLGAAMITVGGILWHLYLPDSAKAAMVAAPVLNVFMALLFAATGAVFLLIYLGPYRHAGWQTSPGFAAALLLFGVVGFTTGEFLREAVRKPYVIYNVVLGSQMLCDPAETARVQKAGYLQSGTWTKAFVAEEYPRFFTKAAIEEALRAGDSQSLFPRDAERLQALPGEDRIALGGLIFQYHCNDCHAAENGYSAVGPMMQGWSRDMIELAIPVLHRTRFTMPQWLGTPAETELLTDYLLSIRPPRPKGMLPPEFPLPTQSL
jgi:cytochrome bd-type quinol oxidase subunit 1